MVDGHAVEGHGATGVRVDKVLEKRRISLETALIWEQV